MTDTEHRPSRKCYQKGCRLAECKKIESDYQAKRYQANIEHEREVRRDAMRRLRARRRGSGIPSGRIL